MTTSKDRLIKAIKSYTIDSEIENGETYICEYLLKSLKN